MPPKPEIAQATHWWNNSWKDRRKITFDNSASAENLSSFPIMVGLNSSRVDYSKTQNSGQDIRFVDADTTTSLDFEIEKWDETGTSTVWVEVPTISSASTTDHIWMYYNNTSAADGQAATSVWDSNFRAVYHMNESSGTTSSDSTSNAFTMTKVSATEPNPVAGKASGGQSFDDVDDYENCTDASCGGTTKLDMGTNGWTTSAWVKVTNADNTNNMVVSKSGAIGGTNPDAWYMNINGSGRIDAVIRKNGTGQITSTNDGGTVNDGTWHHVAVTWNRTGNMTRYVDGASTGTANSISACSSCSLDNDLTVQIGARDDSTDRRWFDGGMDEVRISASVRSADWLEAEYKSVYDNINTFGSAESRNLTATASVDTSWVKGGSTGTTFTFTVNNPSTSDVSISYVKIARPSSNYTITAGSATGWSATSAADNVVFTGGSIAANASATFTVTANTASVDEAQTAWTVTADNNSDASVPVTATASSSGALNTGIDTTAPTSVSISSVSTDSQTQLTATAATASDASAGLHSSPYWFDETTGGSGGTDSTDWQSSTTFIDSGLSAGTQYCYRVKARDSVLNESAFSSTSCKTTTAASASVTAGASPAPQDLTPPVISNIKVSPASTTAVITWSTDEQSRTKVDYGTTTFYGLDGKVDELTQQHKVVLEKLRSNTKYYFRTASEDILNNVGRSENLSFTTKRDGEEIIDSEPQQLTAEATSTRPKALSIPTLVISKIALAAVRPTSAKITWETSAPATSQILFGSTSGELGQATIEYSTLVTQHSVTISDLAPKTNYFFVIVSRSEKGAEIRSPENSFKTESLEIQTVIEITQPLPLPPGSPETQIPKTAAGETVSVVPILPTKGDLTPPEVTFFDFSENPTENPSPTIRGRALDRQGVLAGISYSTDGGTTWHPVSEITGIGSSAARFLAKIPNLRDGNYTIIFRARDNSGNIGKSNSRVLVIDQRPPTTGVNIWLLGSQSVLPSSAGTLSTLSGITQRMIISAAGGAVRVEIIAKKALIAPAASLLPEKSEENEKTSFSLLPEAKAQTLKKQGGKKVNPPPDLEPKTDELIFPLTYSKSSDLWFGDIRLLDPGEYQLTIRAVDGANRVSARPLNLLNVAQPGLVIDAETKKPIAGAKVTVFQFSPEENDFVLWPGEVFNQANPQFTGTDGGYRFILPPGKYYLKAEKEEYKDLYTRISEFDSHEIVIPTLPISPKLSIPLPKVLFGERKLALPSLPDFLGTKRVTYQALEAPQTPSRQVLNLIGKPAPLFSLPDFSGKLVDLRNLRGKKTVLSTWSTWSPLAQIQIPVLDALQKKEQRDTKILLISLQESEGVVDTYLRRGKYQLAGVIDREGKLTDSYPILTTPQHFFLDRKGIVREIYVGFLNIDKLLEKIREL